MLGQREGLVAVGRCARQSAVLLHGVADGGAVGRCGIVHCHGSNAIDGNLRSAFLLRADKRSGQRKAVGGRAFA